MEKKSSFVYYAWGILILNIGVILWGAFVRATGSGAGCGSHWPLCNGEVIPRPERIETLVEFIHRGTSGVAFLGVVILAIWAWKIFPANRIVRLSAFLSLIFIIIEAIVGAGLVLFELVEENDSLARAIIIAIHLLNTFFLLASLALTAWWASRHYPLTIKINNPKLWFILPGLVGMLILGMSGAVTALGDTLFPASSLVEGFRQDLSSNAHSLIRLRIIHPAFAIITGFYLIYIVSWLVSDKSYGESRIICRILQGLIIIQLLAGFMNVVLLAPVWMQIIHLLLADSIWIVLVIFSSSIIVEKGEESKSVKNLLVSNYSEIS